VTTNHSPLTTHQLVFDDPCILFALDRESRPFLRKFPPHQIFPSAPCRARFCGPSWLTVLVLETGMGMARAEAALQWLLGEPMLENVPYRPQVVIAAGFAGALQAGLGIGDVVLATDVADSSGNRWPATWPGDLPPGEWRPPLHRGRVVSVAQLASRPEEKQQLGRQHGALAADMESAALARLCSQRRVPFGCVRSVSDDAHTGLSAQLLRLVAGSQVAPFRVLAALARRPGLAGELWRLARDSNKAARQLAAALGELLTLTLSWGADL
jgi:adenosylhomocysteine nucleosidase